MSKDELKRIPYPGGDESGDHFVAIPAVWRGKHLEKKDAAIAAAVSAGYTGDLLDFIVSLALLEDWSMPGLTGNRDQWDIREMTAEAIYFVISAVMPSLQAARRVKKKP